MSWCNCSVESDSSIDFETITIRTARKEHKCCECRGIIRPGKQYEYVAGKWDGDMGSFKTCMTCVRIREHFCPDGFEYGGLDELLQEGINASLDAVRNLWAGPQETITGLVELVCELLEQKEATLEH